MKRFKQASQERPMILDPDHGSQKSKGDANEKLFEGNLDKMDDVSVKRENSSEKTLFRQTNIDKYALEKTSRDPTVECFQVLCY